MNGGPAFPCDVFDPQVSLRDYFAAHAMQGICAGRDEAGVLIHHGCDWIAAEAFAIADAMLRVKEAS